MKTALPIFVWHEAATTHPVGTRLHIITKTCLPHPFFSADGSYEVTIQTKAKVYYTGQVLWEPPAVYKSSCAIDVEYFPYDIQTCVLKLGSWTYDGFKVNVDSC